MQGSQGSTEISCRKLKNTMGKNISHNIKE